MKTKIFLSVFTIAALLSVSIPAVYAAGNEAAVYSDGALLEEYETFEEAAAAANSVEGGSIELRLLEDAELEETVAVTRPMTITSDDTQSPKTISYEINNHPYLLNIMSDGVLLKDIIIDGGSENGITAQRALIAVSSGSLSIGDGAYIQNNNNITVNGAGGGICLISGSIVMSGGALRGNTAYAGGGAAIVSSASNSFVMTGGEITSNTSNSNNGLYSGGGVYAEAGLFTLDGGSVHNNNSALFGGGFMIRGSSARIEIKSGTVNGNTAALMGGGAVLQLGAVEISGGEISGNTAETYYGGGMVILPDVNNVLTLSGAPVIKNNISGAERTEDDLYIDGTQGSILSKININGSLEGADIGLTSYITPEAGNALELLSSSDGTDLDSTALDALTLQNDGYKLIYNNGNIEMIKCENALLLNGDALKFVCMDSSAMIVLAGYLDGVLIDSVLLPAQEYSEASISSMITDEADTIKAFMWNADQSPLCSAVSTTHSSIQ